MNQLESPRELRRFLSHLRLVTTPGDQGDRDAARDLRHRGDADFDAQMVARAVAAATRSRRPEARPEVRRQFERGCALFGVDPASFKPAHADAAPAPPAAAAAAE